MVRKRTKIMLIGSVALVLLLALYLHASFHLTKEMSSCNSVMVSSNSGPSGDSLRLFRSIAIVAPQAGSADVNLGNLVAKKLKEESFRRLGAREYHRGRSSVRVVPPEVKIYRTAEAAERSKADFYCTILPEAYHYSFWPFAKDWNTKVHVYASTKGVHRGPDVITGGRNRYGSIEAAMTFDYSGRIVGIFTSPYLTNKIAEEIAKDARGYVEKQANELALEFMKGSKSN